MKPVSAARWVVQAAACLVIVYGGWLLFHGQKIPLPKFFAVSRTPAEFQAMTATKTAPPQVQTFNLYMPFRSCRYARSVGAFRGCLEHLVQETVSWEDPLRIWLPYAAFFLVLAVLLGRFTCGWFCPLGFLQDLLAAARRALKIREWKFDERRRAGLRRAGLACLLVIILLSWVVTLKSLPWAVRDGLYLAGCQTCPGRLIFSALTGYPMFADLWRPMFLALFLVSISFLGFFLAGFFVNRVWCSFCPNGILLAFFNRGKFLALRKNPLACARCAVCANACVLESGATYREKQSPNVDHADCVNCFHCVEMCPQKALSVRLFGLKIL